MTKPLQRAVPPMTSAPGDAIAANAIAHAWAKVDAALSPHPNCPLPDWTGGGDTLHQHLLIIGSGNDNELVSQLRHLDTASARFGKVGFVGPASTRRLIEWSMGERVVVLSRMPRDVSDWDLRCPLGSLARALGPQATHAHAGRPFLRVATSTARHWRDRLAAAAQHGFCVGLAGLDILDDVASKGLTSHAASLMTLAPLLRVPGVSWIPLGRPMTGPEGAHAMPPESVDWIDWRTDCDDLADEASLIDNLDLVITLDAAHADLAEGLGVSAWRLGAARHAASRHGRGDSHWESTPLAGPDELADWDAFRLPATEEDWPRAVNAAAKALKAMATEFQGWTR
ncbi:hypothetical protein UC34_16205 [Pandoraea vervacti]|uniref:Glycosyl transferase family 8 n=1 Tax=Pandoraea vervacti TaxID=656178 RepID=A0ABN4FR03_9BURK|nr:hypothetical protein [Pandoraea vervacti]AJP58094.1 hypothetical protein UC34_16205 [Pandoraea vervacti]